MRILNIFLSVVLLVSLARSSSARMMGFDPETTFIDLEFFTNLFKKKLKKTVHIINNEDSPIIIEKAEVSDKGTKQFRDLKDGVDTYHIEVKNLTNREILAYEVTWTLKHPFEDYTYKKISANSIHLLKPLADQNLEFRRDKYFRDDAYYYVEITKVQFNDDESIWEAPEKEELYTQFDAIKKEIDLIKEQDLEQMSTDEIIEQTDAKLFNGDTSTK